MSVYDWIETRVPGGHKSNLGKLLDEAYASELGSDTKDQSALNIVLMLSGIVSLNGDWLAFRGPAGRGAALRIWRRPARRRARLEGRAAGNVTGSARAEADGEKEPVLQIGLQSVGRDRQDFGVERRQVVADSVVGKAEAAVGQQSLRQLG